MATVAVTCPDVSTLQRFTVGEMTPEEVEQLAGHCEGCEHCIRRMHALAARDDLLEALSVHSAVMNLPRHSTVDRLIARLKGIDLTASDPSEGTNETGSDLTPFRNSESGRELYDFLAASQQPDELGRLGPYRVLEVVGSGGMGVVFRAEDPQLRRQIALKAMLPALAASASARQRFLREAQAAAAIKHDHIVTIHQVGEDRGAPFLAMEFLEGESLEARLRRGGKVPVPEALRIGREIAEGLSAAHERGLIHRDIKPTNVWLEGKRARVKILDFGLVRATTDDSTLTSQGAVVGTPAYMAPEQANGEPVDLRSDLFSLGCVLYRMLTGLPPFKGVNAFATMTAVTTHTPRPPRDVDPAIPPALSDLVMRLLAKNPAERPASAQEVADVLATLAVERPAPAATPAPVASPPAPPHRKRRLAVALLGIAALLVAAAVIYVQTDRGTLEISTFERNVKVAIEQDGTQIDILDPQSKQQLSIRSGKYTLRLIGEAEGLELATDQGTNPVTLKRGAKVIVEVRPVPKPPVAKLPPEFTNSLGMEFVLVPKGKSWLSGGGGKPGEREVEILHDFYLGKYEVTQEEWEKFTGHNPSNFSRTGAGKDAVKDIPDKELKRFPVENVSFDDVQMFVGGLNDRHTETGWVYRLPKEAEWEYACRGGPCDKFDTAFDYYFEKPTNEITTEQANVNRVKPPQRTCKVGSYKPNRLGLYDMHGNVCEWCDNFRGLANGIPLREHRGGGFHYDGHIASAALHSMCVGSSSQIGFRLARVPAGKQILKIIAPEAKNSAFPPLDEAWVKKVQALPVEKVAAEIGAELKRRNPAFDGKVTLTADAGRKISLQFLTDAIVDITPVRAGPGLLDLRCHGSAPGKGILVDLSPLRGLSLTRLNVNDNRINDLTPLKEMALTSLSCSDTKVSDLAPLKGMPLTRLCVEQTQVTDLSPLKGMPLIHLRLDFKAERDAEILRSIKTMDAINDQPVAEFWKKAEADRKP
jgi:serine/threonine protein kinase